MLDISERQTNETTILDLSGNVIMGGGSRQLGDEVRRRIKAGETNLLLNFAGVKYLDSSGVGELVALHKIVNDADGSLKAVEFVAEKVEEVLTLSGVLPMFNLFDDEDNALSAGNSD